MGLAQRASARGLTAVASLHALAAGRAAQRVGEIQGIQPCTIHRLLGYQPHGGDGLESAAEAGLGKGAFQYNK